MMKLDKEALACDLAETYHIYDFKALPLSRVALFACGLRDNSRIKMKLSGLTVDNITLLLASAVDSLSLLVWSKTKDAEKGMNRPKSIVSMLIQSDNEIEGFINSEDFENERNKILMKGGIAWN